MKKLPFTGYIQRVIQILRPRKRVHPAIAFWEERAARYGRRSVFSLGHPDEELDAITDFQRKEMFPHFLQALRGNERLALDFGCGTGRFTGDIARMIGGKAIGIDPIRRLIAMAPKGRDIEFHVMQAGEISYPAGHFDVIWICLVMGGFNGALLERTVAEIRRVLKDDGLLFLVENTSADRTSSHWYYRSIDEYRTIFNFASITKRHDYYDVDERISIMTGRKCKS